MASRAPHQGRRVVSARSVKKTVTVEANEEDRLRILLAHVVGVLESRLPRAMECSICQNAKAAAAVPPTKGHRS